MQRRLFLLEPFIAFYEEDEQQQRHATGLFVLFKGINFQKKCLMTCPHANYEELLFVNKYTFYSKWEANSLLYICCRPFQL